MFVPRVLAQVIWGVGPSATEKRREGKGRRRRRRTDDAHHKLVVFAVDANDERVVHDVETRQEEGVVPHGEGEGGLCVLIDADRRLVQVLQEVLIEKHLVLLIDVPVSQRALQIVDLGRKATISGGQETEGKDEREGSRDSHVRLCDCKRGSP